MSYQTFKDGFKSWAGTDFGSAVRLESAMIYDKVLYVDAKRGSDAASGRDWNHALLTINGAQAKLYGGDDSSTNYPGDARARGAFAVVYRGFLTGGNAAATQQIITVSGTHLIGAGKWMGAGAQYESCFVVNGNNLTANTNLTGIAKTYAGLIVEADNVVIDGLMFYVSDTTNNPYLLAISDYETHSGSSGHANSGRGCGVFNCHFQGNDNTQNSNAVYGLGLSGAEANAIVGNHFRYFTQGITIGGGPNRYADCNFLGHNVIDGCATGIKGYNASVAQNTIEKAVVTQKSQYGFTWSEGIDLTTGAGYHCVDCRVGHGTKGSAYVPGTGNFFNGCTYSAATAFYDGS